MYRTRRLAPTALAAALLFPLAACDGDSVTSLDDDQGVLEAVVRDDPNAAGTPAMAPSQVFAQGEFEADARVQVEVDGAWQDVSGLTSVSLRTELQSGEETAGSAALEARTYERARIVLTNGRTHLDAESTIGIGPIGVDLTLSIAGGEEVVVEHSQPVTVEADGTTRLVLDLNSHLWLDQSSIESGTVARSSFESAARILVQ